MCCLKSFGERIMARDPDRQTAEIHICIAHRFNALGTPDIIRVAWPLRVKGQSALSGKFRNNAGPLQFSSSQCRFG